MSAKNFGELPLTYQKHINSDKIFSKTEQDAEFVLMLAEIIKGRWSKLSGREMTTLLGFLRWKQGGRSFTDNQKCAITSYYIKLIDDEAV